MKIILLIGIFGLLLVNISAQQTLTCKNNPLRKDLPACQLIGVTIRQNATIVIKMNPPDFDPNKIIDIIFSFSSIYSVEQGPNSPQD
jgi:hypothetical protein